MKRSIWKFPYIPLAFFKKSFLKKTNLPLSSFRHCKVTRNFIGRKGFIYNGAWFKTKNFDEQTVGCKIGEFAITKKFDGQLRRKHKTKKKQESVHAQKRRREHVPSWQCFRTKRLFRRVAWARGCGREQSYRHRIQRIV